MLNDGLAMGYKNISLVLSGVSKQFGLEPKYYTTHALRIGAATDAFLQGKSIEQIMIMFNWKSRKTARGYVRPNNPDFEKFLSS